MIHKRQVLALMFGLLFATAATADESYLCAAEQTTGFTYDTAAKTWKNAVFRSEKQIAITRAKQRPYAWEAKEVGDSRPAATCERDFNEAGNLFCSGVFDLRFNKRQLRFLYVYPIGYWSDDSSNPAYREGDNTPALAIGKCKAL